MATSDDHSARADFNSQVREFLQSIYGVTNADTATLVARFREDQTNRPLTSDSANFYTYLILCAKGQATSDGFP